MSLSGLLLFAGLAQPSQTPAVGPRDLVRWAVAAVEGDSVAQVRRRWRAALQKAPADRPAQFGLATLDRITYSYADAEVGYRALTEQGPADRWSAAAEIGLALAAWPHASLLVAEQHFRAAAPVSRAAGDPSLEAEALMGLAGVTSRLASPDSALILMDLAKGVLPLGDRLGQAAYQCRRGALEGNAGKGSARATAEEGLRLAETIGEGRLAASCRFTIGILHSQRSQTDSTFLALVSAAREQIRLKDWQAYAITMQWQAAIRTAYASYSIAQSNIGYALEGAARSQNQAAKAWTLLTQAGVHSAVRDFRAAEEALNAAESIFRATGDQTGLLSAVSQRANLETRQGNKADAERRLRAAVPLAGRFMVDWRISVLRRLGSLALERGDPRAADSLVGLARGIADSAGRPGQVLGMEFDFAEISLRAGDLPRAAAALRSQLARSGNFPPLTQHSQRLAMAEIEMRHDRIAAAESLVVQATDALEAYRDRLNDERYRVQTFAVADWASPVSFGSLMARLIAAGRVETVFNLVERRRARLLLDRMVLATATAADSLALVAVKAARTGAGKPSDLRGVQRQLQKGSAVLAFLAAGEAPTSLIAVTSGSASGYLLPSADSLAPLVNRLTRLLENGVDPDSLAETLGTWLAKPLADLPPDITNLLIVADGPLHWLPLDLLRIGGTRIVDRYTVSYQPSATIAVRARPAQRAPSVRILALGDPEPPNAVLSESGARAAFAETGGLPRLDAAGREAEWVARFARVPVLRQGRAAGERFVKALALEQFTLLHLATHAVVDDESPTRTALALSAGGGEDGFLTAAELATKPLRAELVFLSACRTASGALLAGEGVLGLTGPLLAAGARAVIASRWPVNDAKTAEFVRLVYQRLAAGRPVAAALSEAKRAARHQGFSPREWASFEVFGDGDTVVQLDPPTDHRRRRQVLGAILAVATIGLFGWARRRNA